MTWLMRNFWAQDPYQLFTIFKIHVLKRSEFCPKVHSFAAHAINDHHDICNFCLWESYIHVGWLGVVGGIEGEIKYCPSASRGGVILEYMG